MAKDALAMLRLDDKEKKVVLRMRWVVEEQELTLAGSRGYKQQLDRLHKNWASLLLRDANAKLKQESSCLIGDGSREATDRPAAQQPDVIAPDPDEPRHASRLLTPRAVPAC
jgi:hypothetical protein